MIEALCTAIAFGLPPEYDVLIGDEKLSEHGGPPRVVFAPAHDKYESTAIQPGIGRPLNAGRQIATCLIGIEAYCWGKTLDDAWAIGQDVIRSVRGVAPGCAMPLEAGYKPGANVQNGRTYRLLFYVKVPVTMPAVTVKQATQAELTPNLIPLSEAGL